jgi:hypothetical protein
MRNKKMIIAAFITLFVTLLCFSCVSSASKLDQKTINQIVSDIKEIEEESNEKGYYSAKRGVEAALDHIDHPELVKALKNIPKETLGSYLFVALLACYLGDEVYAFDARNAAKLLSKLYPESLVSKINPPTMRTPADIQTVF